ncbi:MAG: hypothetical protein OEZ14_02585 [Acidimicrobiia bacterium]|nr:hypothetical protein [Acidimicrobiia bacterium]MDH5519399.1 hypothetical protein [Acidimicrobiia bacterium]
MGSPGREEEPSDRLDGLRELAHLGERGSRAALAGFVFAVLFVIGWVLLAKSPDYDAPADELVAYYTSPSERRISFLAGFYVIPFAGIAFIWYMAALRARIHRAGGLEHQLFSNVQLMSGTLFVAAVFLIAVIELAAARIGESIADQQDVDGLRNVIVVGSSTGQIFALRTGAVFIGISANRASRAGLFPGWFSVASLVLAIALLFVATSWQPVVLIIPIWVVVTSFVVLSHRRNQPSPVEA